nr:PREDICTED: mucin-5AC-like [Bemisia tabaci]
MDPVGPWSACATSYNSLAGVTGLNASASEIHHQLAASGNPGSMNQSGAGSSSNAQQQARSLLQAAQGNPGGSSANVSSFNVGGFLSPNNYGSVFSSFFQANSKVPLNSVTSGGTGERQTSKHEDPKIDLPYLRENPALAHPIGSNFYSHSPSVSSTPSTPWSQGNSQYPSPFGLLPHETSSKSLYENAFSTNFLSAQAVNQLNTQSRSFLDDSRNDSKKSSCHSPQVALPKTTSSLATNYSSVNSSFYQQSNNRAYSPASENARRSTQYPQQSCPTTSSVTSTNPNRHVSGVSSKTSSVANFASLSPEKTSGKANLSKNVTNKVQSEPQSKVYTELRSVDARNVIESNKSASSKASFQKMQNCRPGAQNFSLSPCSSGSVSSDSQRMQCQRPVTQQNPSASNYSQFASPGSCSETDFLVNNSRNKTMSVSGDSPYSSSSSQNGSDCSVNTSKRISPHPNQASPGRHITNPAYSLYSNTMSTLTSPNTLQHQQLCDPTSNFLNGNYASKQSTPTPISPQDSSNLRTVGHNYSNSSAYPSAIANAKTYNSPEFSSKACWNSPEQSSRGNFTNEYNQEAAFGAHVQSRTALTSNDPRPVSYDNQGSSQLSYQDLNTSRINSLNTAKNLSAAELTKKNVETELRRSPVRGTKPGKKKRKSSEASDLSAQSAFVHSSEMSPHSTGIQPYPYPYYDYGRWNAPNPQNLFKPGFDPSFVPQFANRGGENQQNQLLSLQQYQNAQFLSHRPTLHSLSPVSQKQLNDRGVKTVFETGGGSESSKVIVPDVDEELEHLAGVIPPSKDCDATNLDGGSKSAENSESYPPPQSTEKRIMNMVEKSIVPVAKLSPKIASPGFIGSFLKFLQGEREPSPPPSSRPPRAKLYQPPEPPKKPEITSSVEQNVTLGVGNEAAYPTGTTVPSKQKSITSNVSSQPAIDPRDDLRYFPLPKSSKKSLNSSSEDSDSETTPKATPAPKSPPSQTPKAVPAAPVDSKPKELPPKKKYYVKKADRVPPTEPKLPKEPKKKELKEIIPQPKPKPTAPIVKLKKKQKKDRRKGESSDEGSEDEYEGVSNNAKINRENIDVKLVIKDIPSDKSKEKPFKQKISQGKKPVSSKVQGKEVPRATSPNLPRRETVGRRAKEKTNIILAMKDDEDDDPEFTDSDEDPAWTPKAAKDEGSDEEEKKKPSRKKLRLSVNLTKKSSHLIEDSSSDHESDAAHSSKKRKSAVKISGNFKNTSGDMKSKSDKNAASTKNSGEKTGDARNNSLEACNFGNGDFVIVKSDVPLDHPPLWRADGKMLLQKFESFEKNGEWLHKNISTFSGWTLHNKHNYEPVSVKIRQVTKLETIVKFIRPTGKYTAADNQKIEELMKITNNFQDNFEVYIQTLISQALDSSFLKEILSEKDEYFLTSVNAIDEITLDKTKKLIQQLNWKNDLVTALQTYPCFNELTNLSQKDRESRMCVGCSSDLLMYRIVVYGLPYDNITLAGVTSTSTATKKEYLMCQDCDGKLRIFNKVAHQKYLMFMESSKMVAAKKAEDSSKDTAVILNELLADEEWLHQLFKKVQRNWAEIDLMELKSKNQSGI